MELRIKPETLHKRIAHLLKSDRVSDSTKNKLYTVMNALKDCDGSPVLLNREDINDIFIITYVGTQAEWEE